MQPYVDSLQDANLSAYAHAQEELVCLDCHEPAVLEQVHEGAPDPNITELKERRFPNEFCLDCHVPNEHTSYEEIIERTEDYTVNDEKVNPHDPHADLEEMDQDQFECRYCHKIHKESRGINYCYTCHHEGTFENCNVCH
jgi:formate-dependent nitrite reductase cytochrome c552 subunit